MGRKIDGIESDSAPKLGRLTVEQAFAEANDINVNLIEITNNNNLSVVSVSKVEIERAGSFTRVVVNFSCLSQMDTDEVVVGARLSEKLMGRSFIGEANVGALTMRAYPRYVISNTVITVEGGTDVICRAPVKMEGCRRYDCVLILNLVGSTSLY